MSVEPPHDLYKQDKIAAYMILPALTNSEETQTSVS